MANITYVLRTLGGVLILSGGGSSVSGPTLLLVATFRDATANALYRDGVVVGGSR